jgi:hypothetical protein
VRPDSETAFSAETHYGPRGDICLCLSGGGFRAAAFHLGVVTWLNEQGLLPLVGQVRSVSGGSILAAWLWLHSELLFNQAGLSRDDFREVIVEPFAAYLQRDLRTGPIISTVGINCLTKAPRVSMLKKKVEGLWNGDQIPKQQRSDPNFCILAFDIDRGIPVEMSPSVSDLALQVVASAAFPPIIGPVAYGGRRLVDGGLACNYGVGGDTAHRWRCLMVSDAGRAGPAWVSRRFAPYWLRSALHLRSGTNRAFRDQLLRADSSSVIVSAAAIEERPWNLVQATPTIGWCSRAGRWPTDLAGYSAAMVEELVSLGWQRANQYFGASLETWGLRVEHGDDGIVPSSVELRGLLRRRIARWVDQS